MEEALGFFRNNEIFIYIGLGIIAVWQIRKFALAWQELRGAAFKLERESAQSRLNRAASLLVFIIIIGVAEFALVSFIVPAVPGAVPLLTPTLDLLASPTVTLASTTAEPAGDLATPLPPLGTGTDGCVINEIMILSPGDGESVKDIVEIIGTADIPNFGFYKFEMAGLDDPSWLTIQAGDTITNEGKLGFWDTTRLAPGDYALRLVITDNQGQSREPCVIQVRVEPPTEP